MSIWNQREKYTEKEIAAKLKAKMIETKISKKEFFNLYKNELESIDFVDYMLSGEVVYNYQMFKVASNFLQIDIEDLMDILEDDINTSFRGEVSQNAIELFEIINILFSEIINQSRLAEVKEPNYINIENIKTAEHFVEKFVFNYPLSIHGFLEDNNLEENFLILQFPNNIGVSGIAVKKKARNFNYNCIYINTNEPLGRQNFSFFHELYHIFFEESRKDICLTKDRKKDEIEKRAETFASNILINRRILYKNFVKMQLSNHLNLKYNQVFELQKKFNSTFQAIIYAISDLKKQISSKTDDRKILKHIPKVGENLEQYYTVQWDQLEDKTLKHDKSNVLNSPTCKYIFPVKFKKNLIDNYKNGLTELETLEYIFKFFEVYNELDELN